MFINIKASTKFHMRLLQQTSTIGILFRALVTGNAFIMTNLHASSIEKSCLST